VLVRNHSHTHLQAATMSEIKASGSLKLMLLQMPEKPLLEKCPDANSPEFAIAVRTVCVATLRDTSTPVCINACDKHAAGMSMLCSCTHTKIHTNARRNTLTLYTLPTHCPYTPDTPRLSCVRVLSLAPSLSCARAVSRSNPLALSLALSSSCTYARRPWA
jgi:hypothetical protein